MFQLSLSAMPLLMEYCRIRCISIASSLTSISASRLALCRSIEGKSTATPKVIIVQTSSSSHKKYPLALGCCCLTEAMSAIPPS